MSTGGTDGIMLSA